MIPITDILRQIRKGRCVDHGSQLMAELVRAVDTTGKAAELTLKIKIKPERGGGNQKTLTAEWKAKRPEMDVPEAVFFSDQEGDLHRSDPKQTEMALSEVKTPEAAKH